MEVKLIEIRDRMTFIAAMAVKLTSRDEAERYLLRRAGYAEKQIVPGSTCEPYVLLTRLDGGTQCEFDPYAWGNRTWAAVHLWLIARWSVVESGCVADVEHILGKTDEPKVSERLTASI